MSITIEDLQSFHKQHFNGAVPEINFNSEQEASVDHQSLEQDTTPTPTFQITELVNDYYNLKPATNAALTKQQQAYLKFRAEHLRNFYKEYKPEHSSIENAEGGEDHDTSYEELDY